MTPYENVNNAWPATTPGVLTRAEAERAARKLVNHFKGPRHAIRVSRAWVTTPTSRFRDSLNRGWRRMVHDISHDVWSAMAPNAKNHGTWHAELEAEMVAYVVKKGWLSGTLRPKVSAPRRPGPTDRLATTLAALKRWESKRKRAETAIKKLRDRARRQKKDV